MHGLHLLVGLLALIFLLISERAERSKRRGETDRHRRWCIDLLALHGLSLDLPVHAVVSFGDRCSTLSLVAGRLEAGVARLGSSRANENAFDPDLETAGNALKRELPGNA